MDYKSPRLDNETKSRKEYSVKIDNGHQLKDILLWMQFKLVAEIEKNRESYSLNKMTINFDKVTNLGEFIEVEVMGNEENFEEEKKNIFTFLKELGIDDTIRKDYLELLWERGIIKKLE